MFANVMFYILFYFQGPKKSGFTFLRGRKHQELYMYRGGGGGGLKPETLWNYTKGIYNRLVKSKQKHLDRES